MLQSLSCGIDKMKLSTTLGALLLTQVSYAGAPLPFATPWVDCNSKTIAARAHNRAGKSLLPGPRGAEPSRVDRNLNFPYRLTDFVLDHGQYRAGHW
jgi:hypothetical protein